MGRMFGVLEVSQCDGDLLLLFLLQLRGPLVVGHSLGVVGLFPPTSLNSAEQVLWGM